MLVRRGIFCGLGIRAESGLIHWAADLRGKPGCQLTSANSPLRNPVCDGPMCDGLFKSFFFHASALAAVLCPLVEYHRQQNVNQNRRTKADNRCNGEDQANDHGIHASPVCQASANAKNFLVGFIKC